jgi:hypothetical protein
MGLPASLRTDDVYGCRRVTWRTATSLFSFSQLDDNCRAGWTSKARCPLSEFRDPLLFQAHGHDMKLQLYWGVHVCNRSAKCVSGMF